MTMKIVNKPKVYLIGSQQVHQSEVEKFLADHEFTWGTDTQIGGEQLPEIAGRICYLSYGKGRKTNKEYIHHILESGHGSVLEHTVWNFIFTGVSRSLTHELVRHRAGFGYSQLSQRYVNEAESDVIEPGDIAKDPELHKIWVEAVETSRRAYTRLVEGLEKKHETVEDKTLARKMARQAARSVLPNATETKIFVSANARALRHFIELRGSEHADVEIRALAVELLKVMQKEAPNIFADFTLKKLSDGAYATATQYHKV